VSIRPEPPFERTTCDCKQCIQCCKDQPGPLMPGDFERIAAHLGETPEQARVHFWASPGALMANIATGVQYRIGSITPRRVNGRCVFLDTENRCSIHSVAPFGCAYFDTHMNGAEGYRRGMWLWQLIQISTAYKALRDLLPFATSYKPRRVL
jgi:Fe-S-cluster containining protein